MAASVQILDMTNVKEIAFSPKRKPAGDYVATITKVDDHKKDGKDLQWVFTIQLESDRGAIYPYYCQLSEQALWKIRNLFIAAGKVVPKKRMKVDPNKIVGVKIGITLDDDEFEGKLKSQITATFPAEEVTDEPEEEVEQKRPPMKKRAAKASTKGKVAPVEDDEDDLDEDDDLEEDIDDL